ncbi:DUF6414 family protein [Nesterenkonia sp. K-15-9-6]|uniref:DUF6414 family protein n=1 Tax=Nesterenkonia sp. K-15-9-6 TaxID=3093918 RepID=UPI0040449F3B
MTLFRGPRYLDISKLLPFASHHGIAADASVAVTVRDSESSKMEGGLNLGATEWGGVNFQRGASGEGEYTHNQTFGTHPVSALNRLLDKLAEDAEYGLLQDVPARPLKRQDLECERDWVVSDATEMGSTLSSMFGLLMKNPSLMQSSDGPPAEAMGEFLQEGNSAGTSLVLESAERDDLDRQVILLMDRGHMLPGVEIADLEDELTVFGQIDNVVSENSSYSLKRFLLPRVNRQFRRKLDVEGLEGHFASQLDMEWDSSALDTEGPAVVIRPMAMY